MPDNRVAQNRNRNSVFLGEIERLDSQIVHLLSAGGGDGDCRMIAVSAPSGLHQIALSGRGWLTRAGTASLNVDDYDRYFGDAGVSDILNHQAVTGTACRSDGLDPGHRSANYRRNACDFVFHLDEPPAFLRETLR